MPVNKDFALRIEIIDECLRNRLRKWTLEDLIITINEKLEERHGKKASKRTIQNDLKFMMDEKEAPIVRQKIGTQTFFSYSDKTFSIKNLPVNEEEVSLLKDALNILRSVSDIGLVGEIESIIKKLENSVSSDRTHSESIIQFEKQPLITGIELIDDIYNAIKEKTVLKLSYKPFTADKITECTCHPYLLKEFRNRWFLIGRKNSEETISNFALDRILALKPSSSNFLENDLFDSETYFNNMIGVTLPVGETVQEIDIWVSKLQAPYIKTKPIHFTQTIIKEYKDGGILIRLNLVNNYELRSVLLSYGSDIQVIKPESLETEMMQILGRAMRNY